jgi:choline monooxygenase
MVIAHDQPVSVRSRDPETDGLVPTPVTSELLQPWEIWGQDRFDLEMTRIFARSWLLLGDVEDLVEPGDFITGTIGYQPVVVIRQTDGTLRGFLNNCRHRASGLAFDPAGNCGQTLTCPYHNWTYSIDGSLVGIPDRPRMYPDGIPAESYGLVPIRIAVGWDKIVFGCLSHKAPSFEQWIAPIMDRWSRYNIPGMSRFDRELDVTYDINWKVFAENTNDDLHVRFVHNRLNGIRRQLDTQIFHEEWTSRGYKPHNDKDDPSRGRSDLDEMDLQGHYAEYIYPNLVALTFPTQLWLVRCDPLGPAKMRLFSRIYGLDTDQAVQDEAFEHLETTNHEDTEMLLVLMENLRSPFYRVGPASTWEVRAEHLWPTVRQQVATPLAPDEFG